MTINQPFAFSSIEKKVLKKGNRKGGEKMWPILDENDWREWKKRAIPAHREIVEILKKYAFTATEALKVLEYVESTVECAGQNAKLSQLIGE